MIAGVMIAAMQIVSPLSFGGAAPVDTSNLATKAEVQAVQAAIPSTATLATKDEVAAVAGSVVKTVNGVQPTSGNVVLAIPSTAGLATTAALNAMAATVPTPSMVAPPSVSDSSTAGTMTTIYALANHTHASKARRAKLTVPANGTADVTFSPAFNSPPICAVTAETTLGDTAIVNAQMDGAPTATGMRIRINRAQTSVVALIGLTVLSLPTQIATTAHFVCIEP